MMMNMKVLTKVPNFTLYPPKPTSFFQSKPIPLNPKNCVPPAPLVKEHLHDRKPPPNSKIFSPLNVSGDDVRPSSSSSLLLASSTSSKLEDQPTLSGRTTFWISQFWEETLEKVIYRCRFVTLLGVFGSLIGALLCFIKGCGIVVASFTEHIARSGKAMVFLVEATDVYLLGTVMLVFGMGLYELFVSNLDLAKSLPKQRDPYRSNLFGLFTLVERPKWLEIKSVNELKTKVGHVIVMLLLIGLLDNSKKAAIHTPTDLLCFSASVLLCSGCLYLLSKLQSV